jgi:ATP-dependent DNA ligase
MCVAPFQSDKEKWYASRKLDGVRCLCFVTPNGIEFRSRTGKRFTTLSMFDWLPNPIGAL